MFKITARTVLELGAELISSDIIAFYELVKNCFDAKSKNGAEIRFNICFSRTNYIQIKDKIKKSISKNNVEKFFLDKYIDEIIRNVDSTANLSDKDSFIESISNSGSLEELLENLEEAYRVNNSIEVNDTGSGMTHKELINNYLVIGTPSRRKEVEKAELSSQKKSPYLGEKGIGRLSVMRLGEYLRLETATENDEFFNILEIDWQMFNDIDAMIEDIDIKPKKKRKSVDWNGTKIKISNLTSTWTESIVKEMAEYDFARLVDPFERSLSRPRIAIYWNGDRQRISRMDQALLDHAHAKFSGKYYIKDGEPGLYIKKEALDLGFEHGHEVEVDDVKGLDLDSLVRGLLKRLPESSLVDVGEFSFEAYWFNRRRLTEINAIGTLDVVRKLQKKWSSIMLFRDGFRVFPYGDEDDDWLSLDRKAMGRTGYTLNKMQFVGRVNISRLGNPNLLDQTNREGLRRTAEQEVFIEILQGVIQDYFYEFLKEVERRNKKQPLDLSNAKVEVSQLEGRAKKALAKVKNFVPPESYDLVEELQLAFDEFKDLTERARKKIEEVEADSQQMLHMAGIGLMVEVVAHELARAAEGALGAIDGLRGKSLPQEVNSKLETLKSEMKSVSKRLRILDNLSVPGRQRSENFDVLAVLNDLKDGHQTQFVRHNIEFIVKAASTKVKMVKGLFIQIIENLISNSIYWTAIRAQKSSSYKPVITIKFQVDPPLLIFTDNGPGISPDNKDKIFRPFWSLKEKSKRRGLGLYIARENAVHLGGQLYLSDEKNSDTGRLHQFILELPEEIIQK